MARKQAPALRRKSLGQMTPEEVAAWITATRAALQQKMYRERAYLERRAALGTHTSTDQVYEQEQLLEADLLAALDELEASFPKR